MADISVKIEVLNPLEVIKHKKGRFMGSLVSLWMDEHDLKTKIEEEICKEVISQLREKLNQRLNEEGIIAHLHIEVKESL